MTETEERIIAFLEGKHYRYIKFMENKRSLHSKWMNLETLKEDDRWIGPDMHIWDVEHIRDGLLVNSKIMINHKNNSIIYVP